MKTTTYILFFFLLQLSATAQSADSIKYDYNSIVDTRTSEKIKDYLNDDYYNYDNETVKPSETIWQKFLQWLGKVFRFVESGGKPVSYSFYALMIIFFIVAVIKLLGLNYQTLLLRSSKIKTPEFETFDEDIHNTNFNKQIDDAVKKENYRKAIRFLYILFLKVLTDNELIEWEINKTNKDYRREMKKTKYFSVFKNLTYVYEYVWYGEFQINKNQYNNYYKEFKKVFKDFK